MAHLNLLLLGSLLLGSVAYAQEVYTEEDVVKRQGQTEMNKVPDGRSRYEQSQSLLATTLPPKDKPKQEYKYKPDARVMFTGGLLGAVIGGAFGFGIAQFEYDSKVNDCAFTPYDYGADTSKSIRYRQECEKSINVDYIDYVLKGALIGGASVGVLFLF